MGLMLQHKNMMIAVQQQALQAYLPALCQQAMAFNLDMGTVVEQAVNQSMEVEPNTTWNAIPEGKLYQTYGWILHKVAQASPGEVEITVSTAILDSLEGQMLQDRYHKRPRVGRISIHSQHIFRCLADISNAAQSGHIGRVLHNFFIDNISYIASNNGTRALSQWCFAILQAEMPRESKASCLRNLLREEPGLPERVRAQEGQKAQFVARALADVFHHMDRHEMVPLRPNWLQDELLHRRRPRSRGREEPRGRDNEVVREVVRMVEANEDAAKHGRRMLQLVMGRKYEPNIERQTLLGRNSSEDELDSLASEDETVGIRRNRWRDWRDQQRV